MFLWSTTVAVARSVTEQLGALTAACCIYSLGAAFSTIAFYLKERKTPFHNAYDPKYLTSCGALFVLYMTSLYSAIGLALDRNQLFEIGLINYLWPVLTVMFSIPIFKLQPNRLVFWGCSFALIGIFLVTTQRTPFSLEAFYLHLQSNPIAYALALVAAITWALYSNMSRFLGHDQPAGAVVIFMLATALFLFLLRYTFHETSNWNLRTLLEVGYMSAAATLGYIFWDLGVRKGDFSTVSTVSYFTPLLSTFVISFYLEVSAGPKLWLGCVLIALGAYLSKRALED